MVVHEDLLILYLCDVNLKNVTMQIKRCGEMARKLRFFKEQMAKAGLSPSSRSARISNVDLNDLEVVTYFDMVL